MQTEDPNGFYAILQIPPTASAADIAGAYRRRAMQLHPDRNQSPIATKEFQHLTEAYKVLRDPVARAKYDTLVAKARNEPAATNAAASEPLVCSVCSKVTAQPRYVIFYEIGNFAFETTRTPIQGIFCSSCASEQAVRSARATFVHGWWGLPWGFAYTSHAIFKNLFGGDKPNIVNARLLAYQAFTFSAIGKAEIACAIAMDAITFATKVKPDKVASKLRRKLGYDINDEGGRISTLMNGLINRLTQNTNVVRLRNHWSIVHQPKDVKVSIVTAMIVVPAIFGIIITAIVMVFGYLDSVK